MLLVVLAKRSIVLIYNLVFHHHVSLTVTEVPVLLSLLHYDYVFNLNAAGEQCSKLAAEVGAVVRKTAAPPHQRGTNLADHGQQLSEDLKARVEELLQRPDQLERVLDGLLLLVERALTELDHNDYETELQKLEAKIRKHVKVTMLATQIEIELKLYYEHLQQRLEEEAKRYSQLQSKYFKETFKEGDTTHLKFGSQVVTASNSGSNSIQRNPNRAPKDSTSRIRSKLSFHDIAEFTRRVDVRPFAEKIQMQRTILRQASNSLRNLRQVKEQRPNPKRNNDADLIKQIASGRSSIRIQRQSHNSSSRNSLSSNRRSVSNSQIRQDPGHRGSRPNLNK